MEVRVVVRSLGRCVQGSRPDNNAKQRRLKSFIAFATSMYRRGMDALQALSPIVTEHSANSPTMLTYISRLMVETIGVSLLCV